MIYLLSAGQLHPKFQLINDTIRFFEWQLETNSLPPAVQMKEAYGVLEMALQISDACIHIKRCESSLPYLISVEDFLGDRSELHILIIHESHQERHARPSSIDS